MRVESILQPAIDLNNGLYHSEDILRELVSGQYHLFTSEHSALVTTVIAYPRGDVLHLFLAGGNLEELEQLYLESEKYAKYMNCKSITLSGRLGWQKTFLKQYKMKVSCIHMSKEI